MFAGTHAILPARLNNYRWLVTRQYLGRSVRPSCVRVSQKQQKGKCRGKIAFVLGLLNSQFAYTLRR